MFMTSSIQDCPNGRIGNQLLTDFFVYAFPFGADHCTKRPPAARHRRAGIGLPNPENATVHVIVENQIAIGDGIPVQREAERLMAEELDRLWKRLVFA
jgi:hypothetical protein